jgi:Fe-S oxidoreductase
MCPSYRATMEEKHSTRGRARMLFEMMRGEVIRDGWKSQEVFDALDLCLSCKGCKGDCPVNVDMATYKAEFLSHYYEHRARPRYAYAMGWIHRWARLASHVPRLANGIGGTGLAKRVAGIAPERRVPRFAEETFKEWFRKRGVHNRDQPKVILWADTFNNYFHPEVAAAATEVLEEAGFRVVVPRAPLCCGRPLYDYGFLDEAETLLKQIVTYLKSSIEAGLPMVGLEPSCLTVFRDEMLNLIPQADGAKRLHAQAFTLAEFLSQHGYKPPALDRAAMVHGHCHQKAIVGLDAEKKLFEAMGLKADVVDDGCCGMAGSFGFEQHKYDVSMKVYEHELGPRLRGLDPGTLVLADGFSCKTQIEQATGRRPLHLAQLLRMAQQGEGQARHSAGVNGFHHNGAGQEWMHKGAMVLGAAGAAVGAWYVRSRALR